jgi:hypothetical protein
MAALRWIALALTLGLAEAATAHHATTMFDRGRTVILVGVVREFRWASPHCAIRLMAEGGEWDIEMGPPYDLYRSGWGPRTVRAGDKVEVVIHPARNGSRIGWFVTAFAADGTPLGAGRQKT